MYFRLGVSDHVHVFCGVICSESSIKQASSALSHYSSACVVWSFLGEE